MIIQLSYNLMKYEYSLIVEDDDSIQSSDVIDYYHKALGKYLPEYSEELFTWFKQYDRSQLRSIGLMIVQHQLHNVKLESLTTIWGRKIVGRAVLEVDDV